MAVLTLPLFYMTVCVRVCLENAVPYKLYHICCSRCRAEADRRPVDVGVAVDKEHSLSWCCTLPLLSVSNWAHWICSSGGCLYTRINSDTEQGWEPCVRSCQSGNPSLHDLILSLCCWNSTNVRSDQLRGGRSPRSSRCPSSTMLANDSGTSVLFLCTPCTSDLEEKCEIGWQVGWRWVVGWDKSHQ